MLKGILNKTLQILGVEYILSWLKNIQIVPSGILLILVNIIPIFGVIYFKWNAYDILLLYWIENVVIAIFTIPRILLAKEGSVIINIFHTIFFLMHYGVFSFIGGVLALGFTFESSTFYIENNPTAIYIFFFALLISYAFSFVTNYIIKEEYKYTKPGEAMVEAYTKTLIIIFSIVLGIIVTAFSTNLVIIAFIVVKTYFDLGLHLKTHLKPIKK